MIDSEKLGGFCDRLTDICECRVAFATEKIFHLLSVFEYFQMQVQREMF